MVVIRTDLYLRTEIGQEKKMCDATLSCAKFNESASNNWRNNLQGHIVVLDSSN